MPPQKLNEVHGLEWDASRVPSIERVAFSVGVAHGYVTTALAGRNRVGPFKPCGGARPPEHQTDPRRTAAPETGSALPITNRGHKQSAPPKRGAG